jgi:anti-anti-sigma factor
VTTNDDSRIVVDVGTDLTAATAAHLRSVVAGALQPGRTIDLYLDSVSSYDAAGLGLLLGLNRRIEATDGRLVCVSPSPRLYSGIRKLGLHRVLNIRLDLPTPRPAMEKAQPAAAKRANRPHVS